VIWLLEQVRKESGNMNRPQKKWDAELYSVVGAAGELLQLERNYTVHVEKTLYSTTLLYREAQEGYTIHDPEAYAVIETASANVKEEFKRKLESAGGIQSIVRLRSLLNIFKYGTLSFQYIFIVFYVEITPCLVLLIPVLTVTVIKVYFHWFVRNTILAAITFLCGSIIGWF
jgi:hypothetical protein